ncbi:MAG: hypothetical protein U9O94_07475 [Nanoarchaeota archaeon]|nr:hypothetical protein [Nanoarchaeota archaeon]
MGWLKHLIQNRRSVGKELARLDDREKAKRIALWHQLLSNYEKKNEDSKHFSRKNIKITLENWDFVLDKLEQIEALIPKDLVSIEGEEKLEKEIVEDIERLMNLNLIRINDNIAEDKDRLSEFIKLLSEIHNFLETELYLIRIIRGKPHNVEALLIKLYLLISLDEHRLYEVFREDRHDDAELYKEIHDFAIAVITHEKVKKRILSEEEKFARLAAEKMIQDESRNAYRKLAEAILFELARMAGGPYKERPDDDIEEGVLKMEGFVNSDAILHEIIHKLRPGYDEMKIRAVIWAFRKTFNNGYFVDIASVILYES